jgi:hypothetical protein
VIVSLIGSIASAIGAVYLLVQYRRTARDRDLYHDEARTWQRLVGAREAELELAAQRERSLRYRLQHAESALAVAEREVRGLRARLERLGPL